ncbi:MAG: iron ABC transporter substrate-binding protein [bacterium]
MKPIRFLAVFIFMIAVLITGCETGVKQADDRPVITVTDARGRKVKVPEKVENVICSGSGCLRYLVYLQASDQVVGVDDIEKRERRFDARPYAIAHPELKELPLFGEFRGYDNPELIVSLDPQPDVIFKTYSSRGFDPQRLQNITGIPVIALDYGDLVRERETIYSSLQLMGKVINKNERADEVIEFFETTIADLNRRTENAESSRSCYVGGIALKGPHGLQSTEPLYPPFYLTNINNAASAPEESLNQPRQIDFSREKIVETDPDIIFIDLATLQSKSKASALHQLRHNPAYRTLSVHSSKEVYGLLPYNLYTQNHGSTLANAYFVGKTVHPGRFDDINPARKADQIYTFLLGRPVFKQLNEMFDNRAYSRLLNDE